MVIYHFSAIITNLKFYATKLFQFKCFSIAIITQILHNEVHHVTDDCISHFLLHFVLPCLLNVLTDCNIQISSTVGTIFVCTVVSSVKVMWSFL